MLRRVASKVLNLGLDRASEIQCEQTMDLAQVLTKSTAKSEMLPVIASLTEMHVISLLDSVRH